MYKDLNDYEILYMIKEEENSFNYLYSKYQPLIYNYVKKYEKFFKKYGYDLEDLLQLGYITLYKASLRYSDFNNALFFTYFQKALQNALITEMKINSTLKKEVLNSALSYDVKIGDTDISYLDIIPCREDGISNDIILLITKFKNSMSYELSWVFELFYNGYNKNEIGILLNKNINEVSELLKRIKSHALTYKCLFLS